MEFLEFGFPVGYEGPVPTPDTSNHASAVSHLQDLTAYINKEVEEGTMHSPFKNLPFTPWCQVNALLTKLYKPKKDSDKRRVIMDLSCPLPPSISVNGCTPGETYLGIQHKVHLPSAQDLM